jgi:hypothetical protein
VDNLSPRFSPNPMPLNGLSVPPRAVPSYITEEYILFMLILKTKLLILIFGFTTQSYSQHISPREPLASMLHHAGSQTNAAKISRKTSVYNYAIVAFAAIGSIIYRYNSSVIATTLVRLVLDLGNFPSLHRISFLIFSP